MRANLEDQMNIMFNEMKKVKNYYLKNLKLMKKNNSDTQKNQLNEKTDEKKQLTFKN